jgi:hypothetical protein
VTYDHGIVASWRQGAVCFVGDWDILKRHAGLEGEFGDDGDLLVGDELDVWVLGLFGGRGSSCLGACWLVFALLC